MAVISFGSSPGALTVQRMLARSSEQQARSSERLASGLRINRASDDAVGLAIADKLRTGTRLFSTAIRNTNDAISLLNIAGGAQSSQSGILDRLAELAEQSANGVYTTQQRRALDTEYQTLIQEFGRIGSSTTFNGVNLLSGGRGSTNGNTIGIQVGINGGSTSNLSFAVTDSGVASGQIGFSQLASYGSSTAMTTQQLSDFYGQGLLQTTVRDSTGVTRDVRVALTRGYAGSNGQQIVQAQVYIRQTDSTANGSGSSDTWLLGARGDLTVNTNGTVADTAASTFSLAFKGGVASGQASVDLRGLTFGGGYAGVSSVLDVIYRETATVAGVVQGLLRPEQDLFNDLGIDSLTIISLASAIETATGISIAYPTHDFTTLTLGEFSDYFLTSFLSQRAQTSVIDFSGVDTQSRAKSALEVIQQRKAELSSAQGIIGSTQSRLETALSVLGVSRDTYAGAESRIRDVDVAQETASLIAAKTKQQVGAAILAQTASQPQLALSLLRF